MKWYYHIQSNNETIKLPYTYLRYYFCKFFITNQFCVTFPKCFILFTKLCFKKYNKKFIVILTYNGCRILWSTIAKPFSTKMKRRLSPKSKAQHRQWLEKVIPVTKLPNKLTAYRISQELDIVCSNKWKKKILEASYLKLIIWQVKAIVQSQLYFALIANNLLNYLIFKHEFCFKKVNHYLGSWIFPFSFIWINKRYLIVWTSKFQNMNLSSILMSSCSACNIQ